MKPALAELLHSPLLWRGDELARTDDAVSSGFASLDHELPGGGWPKAALTEIAAEAEGIGEFSLLVSALKRLAQAGEWIALLAPPHLPYGPAFAGRGIDPARVIVVKVEDDRDCWWAAEQVLRANSAGALLFWPKTSADQRMRRLQLAAQEGEALAFVFTSTARAAQPSPAPLRLRLALSGNRLSVDIFKRRGGVVSRPLLLDVSGTDHDYRSDIFDGKKSDDRSYAAAMNNLGLSPISDRRTHSRRYAIRGSQARIWNHALARADELRRVPGPDPRERVARDAPNRGERSLHPQPFEASPCVLHPGRE
jgi:cell division inhibitor SulA/protein ImuA